MESDKSDELSKSELESIEDRVDDLEAENQQHREWLKQMMPDRRGVIKGLGAAALGGAPVGGATGGASGQSAAGQVGTESAPVDVEAANVNAGSVSTERVVSPSNSPNIVAYEDGGNFFAVTQSETYTGDDILDVLQQAADSYILNNSGEFSAVIAPGSYAPSTTLNLTQAGVDRISIESMGVSAVYIDVSNLSSGPVVEIDPSALSTSERYSNVKLSNLHIADPNENRTVRGVRINDCNHLRFENCRLKGLKQAWDIEHVWQGEINHVSWDQSGDSSDGTPAARLASSGSQTAEALNHVQINHCQGGPGVEVAYLDIVERVAQCDINFPNPELPDGVVGISAPGGSNIDLNIRGMSITGGNPAISLGPGDYQIVGGAIESPNTVIQQREGTSNVALSGLSLKHTGGSSPVIDVSGSRLAMAGCRISGGSKGVYWDGPRFGSIGSSYFDSQSESPIFVRNSNFVESHPITVVGVVMNSVCSSNGNPVTIDNSDNIRVADVSAAIDSSRSPIPVVSVSGSDNISVGGIVPGENASSALSASNSTFRDNTGTVTLNSGSTSVTVSHGLSNAPAPGDIDVRPIDGWTGSSATKHQVPSSSINTTSFDIAVDADPTQDVTFGFHASL